MPIKQEYAKEESRRKARWMVAEDLKICDAVLIFELNIFRSSDRDNSKDNFVNNYNQ